LKTARPKHRQLDETIAVAYPARRGIPRDAAETLRTAVWDFWLIPDDQTGVRHQGAKPMRWKLILPSLMVWLCGCEAIKNENEVYGSYELTFRDGKILLDVAADHSYSETIRFSNQPEQKNSGEWQWRDGRVCFNALLVPRPLMKVFENAKPWQPKVIGGAYQLDHCIPAGKEYGKTILEINPDAPENFVKVSSATARQ
jgi:hypothetical protein